ALRRLDLPLALVQALLLQLVQLRSQEVEQGLVVHEAVSRQAVQGQDERDYTSGLASGDVARLVGRQWRRCRRSPPTGSSEQVGTGVDVFGRVLPRCPVRANFSRDNLVLGWYLRLCELSKQGREASHAVHPGIVGPTGSQPFAPGAAHRGL